MNVSISYIGNLALNSFVFLILIAVYSYVMKMEDIGCACSDHPNKEFIKQFSVVALISLLVLIFLPPDFVADSFGSLMAGLFAVVKFIFYMICIVYFYMILDYTRYLVNEKCKCSEDIRRELIMAGSIVEIALMLMVLLVIMILPLLFNSVTYIIQNFDNVEKGLGNAVQTPYKSLKKLPSKFKKATSMTSKFASRSMKSMKGMKK